jgi:hypothetical protein
MARENDFYKMYCKTRKNLKDKTTTKVIARRAVNKSACGAYIKTGAFLKTPSYLPTNPVSRFLQYLV